MRIGFDLDDVLASCMPALIMFHNERYATAMTHDAIKTYNLELLWNCSFLEARERVDAFYDSDHFKNMLPVDGAVEGISQLKERHELYIITARQLHVQSQTESWVEQHFPGMFSGVFLANHYSTYGESRKKSDFCKEHKLDYLVDDNIQHINDCVEEGISTLLFDKPWNQDGVPNSVPRVKTWRAITVHFYNAANHNITKS